MENRLHSESHDCEPLYSADPSERRLVVVLSPLGVCAYLKHNSDASAGYRQLIDASWSRDDDQILRRIENAIYDHPEVLDDYECDVVAVTDRFLWMPAQAAADEELADDMFMRLYPTDADDILREEVKYDPQGDMMLLFTLCPGLPAFLRRTFPGARVSCQQSQLFRRFAGRHPEASSLFADIHDGRIDILAFKGKQFVMGAIHLYGNEAEAEYHILNCLRAAGIDAEKAEVYLSGERELRQRLLTDLRDGLPYVRNAMLPRIDAPLSMPTPALICATQPRASFPASPLNDDSQDENNQR